MLKALQENLPPGGLDDYFFSPAGHPTRFAIHFGDSIEWLKTLPDHSVDVVDTDPPYFLSNGGTTNSGGKRVKVHKGDWDKSNGIEADHEFFIAWLKECKRILKPDGSIFITGTHHCIYSIGYALKKLGFHVLNDITWVKPAPPPNLGCRQLTDDHETIIWAIPHKKKSAPLPHRFNYDALRSANLVPTCPSSKCGLVGRAGQSFCGYCGTQYGTENYAPKQVKTTLTFDAPDDCEKWFTDDGKAYPAQKPVKLMKFLLGMVAGPGAVVLDPFMGSASAGVAAAQLDMVFIGNDGSELAYGYAKKRLLAWHEHEGVLPSPTITLSP